MGKRFTLRDINFNCKGKNKRIFWFHSLYVLWETAKIVIKEQVKQENQRKLFEKLSFMTIRPEFNNGVIIEAV